MCFLTEAIFGRRFLYPIFSRLKRFISEVIEMINRLVFSIGQEYAMKKFVSEDDDGLRFLSFST